MLFVKFVVLILLGFVIVSLFSGLYFLVKDKGQTNRTVNALSLRVGFSMLAIVIILIAGALGVIKTNPSPLSAEGRAQQASAKSKNAENTQPASSGRRRILE